MSSMSEPNYPDNTILLDFMKAEFSSVRVELTSMNGHLEKLNGQVAKNTGFRNKSFGIWIGISTVIGIGFTILNTFVI